MINRIIDLSVENKFVVFILVLAGCVFGWSSMKHVPLDAIPDLSDSQVIIYSRWDRSPDLIEDQVTYPIISALVGAPRIKTVRGFSDFGYSYVYAIFEDGTDIYWARSRTLEYLSSVLPTLPTGVKTELGPDATGVGWIFQYVLVDTTGKCALAELRSLQDWYLRYQLRSVKGVAEVASLGGFGRQFQVNLDPRRLQAYAISVTRVAEAVREGNSEVGGRLLEMGGSEYMVRGRGYARSIEDFGNIAVAYADGTPIRVKDLGAVSLGPNLRRGVTDLDGQGEAVSGIVVMRQGENALEVIRRVKSKLHEIQPSLPNGVRVVPVYDRSELIERAIKNVKWTLIEVVLTVALTILVFLWHFPTAVIPIVTVPTAMLLSFIPFRALGITANIMSLAGLAIACGALVDAAIVVVEQSHKKLEALQRETHCSDYRHVVLGAVKEVGAPTFLALLVIGVSFLPVLALEGQEGRMFKPLAYTKTLAMLIAALLAITLDPALRLLLTRFTNYAFHPRWLCRAANLFLVGRVRPEEQHPISRRLMRAYEPVVRWSLRRKWWVIGGAVALVMLTLPVFIKLGSEFMPPLDEGSILYMPSTMPGISITEAQKLLQITDRVLREFPEVDRVLGKAGRADTSTDPAPLSMLETVIILKPQSQWRRVPTWYSRWSPEWMKPLFRHITSDHISTDQLISEMNRELQIPGVANAWTMPIKGRIDMLTTGIRTPIGIKISGPDLNQIEEIGTQIEAVLPQIRGTRNAFAERVGEGHFIDVDWNREQLAAHGVSMEDAQATVQSAIGGENVTTAIEGRERYPVNVRYMRDFRSDVDALKRVSVPAIGGQQVPLSQLASIQLSSGPSMIRDEDGLPTGYVYIDVAGRDGNGYVKEAARVLKAKVHIPARYTLEWSGQFEGAQRVRQRLMTVVPLTLGIILLLLYLNTRSVPKTLMIMLAVPFSAVGAIWLVYMLGYNMSIAVWIGLIALLGVDAETGVFMLLYLDLAYESARREGRLQDVRDLQEAIVQGAARRLRPKFMTFLTTCIGLIPILWATGTGSDVMKRIAAPMVGGIFSSFVLELIVYPALYQIWRGKFHLPRGKGTALSCQLKQAIEEGFIDAPLGASLHGMQPMH
jgi:Cu(I)/Ag(I) efflux system membrane protein CusA/SilA